MKTYTTSKQISNNSDTFVKPPRLSVVIPSYCSSHLEKVINAAKYFEPFEIIVVDSSPIKPNLKDVLLYHQPDRLNAAAARNKGASLARGELLLFIDSDVILTKNNISTIKNHTEIDQNIICGLYIKNLNEGKITRFQRGVIERRLNNPKKNSLKIWSSSHFLISKESFLFSGGFNETFDNYEDVEFFLRCEAAGMNIKLDQSFTGIHLKEFNVINLIKDYWKKTAAAIKVRIKLPKLFRGNPGDIPLLMHISGALGLTSILFINPIFLFGFSFNNIFVPTSLFLILISSSFLLYPKSALKVSRTKGVILWTICYGTIWLSLIFTLIQIYIKKTYLFLVSFCDFIRNGSRVFLRNGRPVQIINYVTSRCNLRCSHCFYKESLNNPDPGEIPRERLIKTMKSIGPVLWYSLAGGEPFIRPDLENLIQDVQENCRPKVFSFPTNGWYTERTFKTVLRTLQRLERGNLILFFSLDGPKDIHDEIRGKGSFDNLSKTLERLRPLKKIYKNLYTNFILTVTPQNAAVAPIFIREISKKFNADSISINLYREHSPDAPRLPKSLIDAYQKTVEAYAEEVEIGNIGGYKFIGSKFLKAKEFVQKQMILKVAKNNEFVTPCTAGTLSYIIMEDGAVKPCEILHDEIGNIKETNDSFNDIVNSTKAKNLRKWIKDTKCKCTYECAMSTNTLFSLPIVPKLIAKTLIPDKVIKLLNKSLAK